MRSIIHKGLVCLFLTVVFCGEVFSQTTPSCLAGQVRVGNECREDGYICIERRGSTLNTPRVIDPNGGSCESDQHRTMYSIAYDTNGNLLTYEAITGEMGAVRKLIGGVSREMWRSDQYLENTIVSTVTSRLCKIGLLMAFLLLMAQTFLDFVVQVLGQGTHPMKIIQKNLAKLLLVVILLTPSIYETITVKWVGGLSDVIANDILGTANEGIAREMTRSAGAIVGRNQSGANNSFWTKLGDGLVVNIIGAIIFWFSFVLTLILGLLQSGVFALAFFLGPLCIPFLLFDGTSSIPRNWFSFLLAVCFFSIVASLALLIAHSANFYSDGSAGASSGNAIMMLIYGAMTIVLMVISYPIAASLTGNSGGVGGIFATGAGLGVAAAGVVAGAALGAAAGGAGKAAGAAGKAAGSSGSAVGNAVGKVAGKVASASNWVSRQGYEISKGQMKSIRKKVGGEGLSKFIDGVKASGGGGRAPTSRKEEQRLEQEKNTMAERSAAGASQIRDGRDAGSTPSGNLDNTLSQYGYNRSDVSRVNYNNKGDMVGVTTNTGDQFTMGKDGWSAAGGGRRSSLADSVAGSAMTAESKQELQRASSEMTMQIQRGGNDMSEMVRKALSGTGYNNRDVDSVSIDRLTNRMSGVTMRTGEQFSYNAGRNEFTPTVPVPPRQDGA